MDVLIESDPDDSEDEYHTEGDVDEPTSASSDDEYGGRNVGSARKGWDRSNRRLKRQQSPSAPETGTSSRLTSQQKKEARQTFALFF